MARKKAARRATNQVKSRKKRPFLPYPLLIFLLLCAGVFLVAWTLRASADDVLVTAKVAAPTVNNPASITGPADGQHFSTIPISVTGNCPANAAYVEIFDNGTMRETAICNGASQFNLSVDLFTGGNDLTARVFNSTDDEGPVSGSVNVVYEVSNPPAGVQGQPSTNQSPLELQTAFVYKGYHVGDTVTWPIEVSGGSAPYAVSVDWGDGTSDLLSRTQAGQFKINHTYGQAGGYKDSYTIKVQATDAQGNRAYLQFFVIVVPKSIGQGGSIYSKPPPSIGGSISWLWFAWPAYLLVVLMVLSYWLGEREELIILRKKGVLKR